MNREELIEELKELKEVYHHCDCGYVNIDEDYGEVIERVIQLIQPTPLTEEVEELLQQVEKMYDSSLKYNAIIFLNEEAHNVADEMFFKYKENIKSQITQQEQRIKELEKSDASKEESSIHYYNEMRKLQSKLQAPSRESIINTVISEFNKIGEDVSYNYTEDIFLLDGGLLCYQGKDGVVFNTDIIPNKALKLLYFYYESESESNENI